MVPDAYDECARCGKFYYSHEAQELSRRERHAFTPREAVPSELSTLRAKLAEVEAERDGAVAVLRRIAEELPSDQTTTAKLAVRAALFQMGWRHDRRGGRPWEACARCADRGHQARGGDDGRA